MQKEKRSMFGKAAKLGFVMINAMMLLWFAFAITNGWLTGQKALHMGAGWLVLALFFGIFTFLTRPASR